MRRILFLAFIFCLIPTADARVVYITNFGRINIEERCTDGKADHQIWYMDVGGKIKKLNLKGQGNRYFKYPELIPSDIVKTERGYLCSRRQLTKKEMDAYQKMFIDASEKKNPDKGCIKWD